MRILVLRFSSIGDIVLTTPIIRCLYNQIEDVEVHFLTKKAFANVLEHNPYIKKIHTFEKSINEVKATLKQYDFDLIIDLHKNLRSSSVIKSLKTKSLTFDKLNWQKWLKVTFKVDFLLKKHIVERYFDALKPLGIVNDGKGLDFFIDEKNEIIPSQLNQILSAEYACVVVGAAHKTKQIPEHKIVEWIEKSKLPVVLLGGPGDKEKGKKIEAKSSAISFCGELNLLQSASLLSKSALVLTPDTGLMHIAAAFKIPTISVWGNTIPEFGMTPYMDQNLFHIAEVKNLSCRPCSKIGYNKCPKGHFKCMKEVEIPNSI